MSLVSKTPVTLLSFVGALLLLSAAPVSARTDYSPARLLEGDRSIESLLRLPEHLPIGLHIVRCETWISAQGRARGSRCYSETEPPGNLLKRVELASEEASYAPATRDGNAIQACMPLMVRVYVAKDGPLVLAVPNSGTEEAKHGLLYSAPQRLTRIRWPMYWEYDAKAQYGSMLLWYRLEVDVQGKVTASSLTNASQSPAHLVNHFESQVGRLEFIPGFVDKKPTAMVYVKPLYNDYP